MARCGGKLQRAGGDGELQCSWVRWKDTGGWM